MRERRKSAGRQTRGTNLEGSQVPHEKVDMKNACFHTFIMHTMIQIRNVPQSLHRRLKARAAMEGTSMSQYVLRAIERALDRPSRQELLASIRSQPELRLEPSPAEVLHEERNSR